MSEEEKTPPASPANPVPVPGDPELPAKAEEPYLNSQRFIDSCRGLRRDVLPFEERIKALLDSAIMDGYMVAPVADIDEMKANLWLAYRHLEDARMRLGKAIQACDGGASVYKD